MLTDRMPKDDYKEMKEAEEAAKKAMTAEEPKDEEPKDEAPSEAETP